MSVVGGNFNLSSAVGTLNLSSLQAGTYTRLAPADPTGTISTTGVMMGTGGTLKLTPSKSGNVELFVFLKGKNGTVNDGWTCDLRYGTGVAPANGDALTGTLFDPIVAIGTTATIGIDSEPAANTQLGQFMYGRAALTVNTAYWFDIALKALTGGTATISSIQALVMERSN